MWVYKNIYFLKIQIMFDKFSTYFSSVASEARKALRERQSIAEVKRLDKKEDSLANLEKYSPEEIKVRVQELTDGIVSNNPSLNPDAVSMTLPILIDLLWLDKSYDERLVDMNSGLVADLGADSLDNVEILDEMEERLAKKLWVEEINISNDDADNMFKVGDIIRIMSKKLENIQVQETI